MSRPRAISRTILSLCAAAAFAPVKVPVARGHAVQGTFTTNRCLYIVAGERRLDLRYTAAVGPLPAARIRTAADLDGNGTLSRTEVTQLKKTHARKFQNCLSVTLNGKSVPLHVSEVRLRLEGAEAIYLPLWMEARLHTQTPTRGRWTVSDRCRFPASGVLEILLHPAPTLQIKSLKARGRSTVRKGQVLFEAGPGAHTAEFRVMPGTGQGGAPGRTTHRLTRSSSLLWNLVRHDTSVPFLLGATLLAFLLGAYHALSPGHGKTMVAAYLVGHRASVRQALLLSSTVTFAHTFSIALLGVAVLLLFGRNVPDFVYPYLNLGSGLAIAAVGVYLLIRSTRPHAHHHGPPEADENLQNRNPYDRATVGSLLTLGITGGLVPCPTALVVLLLAMSQGRTLLGLYLILMFGLGLSAVLAVIGIVAVKARAKLDRLTRARALTRALPRLSASVIVLVGLAIAVGPLWSMLQGP